MHLIYAVNLREKARPLLTGCFFSPCVNNSHTKNKVLIVYFYTECKYQDKVNLLFFRSRLFFPPNFHSAHRPITIVVQNRHHSEPQHQKQWLGSSLSVPLCPKRCLTKTQIIKTPSQGEHMATHRRSVGIVW